MTDYADSVEPFVGPTVGGPATPDTAYRGFKAGVIKAQQDQDAQLARRAETPYGKFLDILGTGLMMIPAGPLRTPTPRVGSAPLASPRPPAASEAAAGELHELLAPRRIAAEGDIRPPNENLRDVIDSNFNHGRVVGDEMVPIEQLTGGTRASSPSEQARIKSLSDDMRGEGGYIERLIIDDAGNVVEGQHRLDAMRDIGIGSVPVVRVKDLGRGIDTKAMGEAIRKAGPTPSDHVHQITRNALEMIDEAGSAEAALLDYDLPASHRAQYEAALRSAVSKVVPLRPEGRPQEYTPYEIPKASRDHFTPADNSNQPGGKLSWRDNREMTGRADGTKGQPDHWHVSSSGGDMYGSVIKTPDPNGGTPNYHASTFEPGERYSMRTGMESFKTLDAAKAYLEGHITGQPVRAEVLRAREDMHSIAGGRREAKRESLTVQARPSKDVWSGADPNAHEINLVDSAGKVHYRGEITQERGGVWGIGHVENVSREYAGMAPELYRQMAKYAEDRGGTLLGGMNTNRLSQAVLDQLEADGTATRVQHGDRTLYRITSGAKRGKFGDAKDVEMFYPPRRATQPFEEDFPHGAEHEGSGIITRDREGRPLTAPFVAGRNVVGGPNQPIAESHYNAVNKGLLGEVAQDLPPSTGERQLGATHFDNETGIPSRVEIARNIRPDLRPHVHAHELGHVIDQFAGEIPVTGIEQQLYKLYNSLNNPIRTRGGNDAQPWSPRMTPKKHGYDEGSAPRELMAEAVRAYMQNPNFIKVEAPAVAARIRAYVNAHPWLKQTIQFNSLAGLGVIATEHDQQ